mmetsp:Transcript_3658/g.10407  ORF Transcript_3658/g.10407 Transcript_3658/m.10407 type:complete len:553 (+) Transcript_3658:107-1765(+)
MPLFVGLLRKTPYSLPTSTSKLQARRSEALPDDVHDGPQVFAHRDRWVGVLGGKVLDLLGVVRDLGVHELEAVGGADHHGPVRGRDGAVLPQLHEGRESHPGVGAVEHPGPVRQGGGVHELLLARLLHDSPAVLERLDRPVDAHGVADLDGAGEGGLGLHGLEDLPVALVHPVKGIGVPRLGHHHLGHPVRQAEIHAHLEALVKGVHVPEVPSGDDQPVRDLPVELLHDLDRGRLLALDSEGVHGVRQVNGRLRGDLPDQAHAPVKVRVDGEDEGPVGDGLHELGQGDLVRGKEDDGRDVRRGAVGREGCGSVPRGCAPHGRDDVLVLLPYLVHLAHQDRHSEVLEATRVAVAALLHPKVRHPQHRPESLRPKQVAVALEHAHDVVVVYPGQHPLLLAPHAAAVRPGSLPDPLVEQRLPVLGAVDRQRLHVVLDVQEPPVVGAIDDLVEGVLLSGGHDELLLLVVLREWFKVRVEKVTLLHGRSPPHPLLLAQRPRSLTPRRAPRRRRDTRTNPPPPRTVYMRMQRQRRWHRHLLHHHRHLSLPSVRESVRA